MALRLVEIVLPERLRHTMDGMFDEIEVSNKWDLALSNDRCLTTLLLPAEKLEALLDEFERRYSHEEGFRLLLLPVEATIPRENSLDDKNGNSANAPAGMPQRVSRQELYDDIDAACGITSMFIATVVLSTIVAAVGLLRDNTAAIIGAMVIAPLLGPNAGLALATTLGDWPLAKRAVSSSFVGVILAFGMAITFGALVQVDPTMSEFASRTTVGFPDVAIALAAGVAGSLAFSSGVPSSLIGVMVAVALLPPTVACGMLAGGMHWAEAGAAFLILSINVASVNLAGVATFWVQGLRPHHWLEARRAKRATYVAITLWVLMLTLLTTLIYIAKDF